MTQRNTSFDPSLLYTQQLLVAFPRVVKQPITHHLDRLSQEGTVIWAQLIGRGQELYGLSQFEMLYLG